ncbi:MAG: sugar ABC transporter permease [Clostridiales bacterium]|nr:sugar ABC transporter permease [Clostridiales bacterium]
MEDSVSEYEEEIELDTADVDEFVRQQEASQIHHVRSSKEQSSENKKHGSQKKRRIVGNTIIHIVLVIMSIIWVAPFVFILFESFRVESTGLAGYIIPHKWGFDNYVRLFTETEFPRWFLSTFLMGLFCAVVQTIFILAMSYALSRNRFKGRKFLMNAMLVLGMFPGFLTLILLYTLLHEWGLTGTNAPFGLAIIYVASSGMGYYVCKGFFDTISHSLDEAAMVDGATKFQIFYKIIIPMSKPIVIYTILMGFMGPWGDFITASFMSDNLPQGFNVATGLQSLIDGQSSLNEYYTTFCAGGVMVALPITLLFMFLQKYYVAGVTGGAVKG